MHRPLSHRAYISSLGLALLLVLLGSLTPVMAHESARHHPPCPVLRNNGDDGDGAEHGHKHCMPTPTATPQEATATAQGATATSTTTASSALTATPTAPAPARTATPVATTTTTSVPVVTGTRTPVATSTSAATAVSTLPAGGTGGGLRAIKTVFLIVLENHNWSSFQGSASAPYLNGTLLPQASYATQYFTPAGNHPSLPNYLWLESGQCFSFCGTDNNPSAAPGGLTGPALHSQLSAAGVSWHGYFQGISGGTCPLTATGGYAPKHDPFVYYSDVSSTGTCPAIKGMSSLPADLAANTVARYNLIVPDLCNDGHDSCAPLNDPVKQSDAWLASTVPAILASPAYKNNGVLFITWDEGESTPDGPIGLLALSPLAKGGGYHNAIHYTHSALLRTNETIFGLPLLGDAQNGPDLSDLFGSAAGAAATGTPGATSPTPVATHPAATSTPGTMASSTAVPTAGSTAAPPTSGGAPALHVQGHTLVDAAGATVRLLGVDRSGAEYMCLTGSGIFDGPVDATAIAAIKSWHTNAVRVPLNEDCWLGINGVPAVTAGSAYQAAIVGFVGRLNAAGLDVILDLHWNAPGGTRATGQQNMPDADHTPAFWSSVAQTFKGNNAVLFDLYNEPHDVSWSCWLSGGSCAGVSYQVAGMQTLVDAVRATGATNVILAGGLAWANDLTGWLANRPHDPTGNLAASFHVYNFNACANSACWDSQVAPVAAAVPVVTGELGENDCAHGFIDQFMPWADAHGVGYLGWDWGTDFACSAGPGLITNYDGTPTNFGVGLRDHLMSLHP